MWNLKDKLKEAENRTVVAKASEEVERGGVIDAGYKVSVKHDK